MKKIILLVVYAFFISISVIAQADSTWFINNYYKIERYIPMREGIKLFTSVYIPKDKTEMHPILMTRTPYSGIFRYLENLSHSLLKRELYNSYSGCKRKIHERRRVYGCKTV